MFLATKTSNHMAFNNRARDTQRKPLSTSITENQTKVSCHLTSIKSSAGLTFIAGQR